MIAIDTETTGLWWQHDTHAFAVGWFDGEDYNSITQPVDPLTRLPRSFSDDHITRLRSLLFDSDMVVFQNANFDLKALAKIGVIDWHEPSEPVFWENIYDLGSINHLYDNRDSGVYQSSLKCLGPKYLDEDYASLEVMDKLINRCRTFVRNRTNEATRQPWMIGNEKTLPQAAKDFGKSDMWLPMAIRTLWPDQQLVKKYFGAEDYEAMLTVCNTYLRDDCQITYRLAEGFLAVLFENMESEEVEHHLNMNHDVAPAIWDTEVLGVHVDHERLLTGIETCNHWIETTHKRCCELAGQNVEKFTPAIIREYLFEECSLEPITYTPKAKLPQVDSDRLLLLKQQCEDHDMPEANEFLSNLLANGKYTTKKQYLEGYARTVQLGSKVPYEVADMSKDEWYLFPSLKATGTGTTRFSSSNPNSQNIEKASNPFEDEFDDIRLMLEQSPMLRSVFGPPPGYWWFPMDYKQLQLRIFAALTQEESLIQSFRDGWDFHDFMAHAIFDLSPNQKATSAQRRVAKAVNFGFIFGASEKKVDATTNRKGMYAEVMRMFPNAKEFIEETKQAIRETGVVYTMGGYPLHIPLRTNNWNGREEYAAHMGVCYRVQGTEGEIVKKAMVDTNTYLKEEYRPGRLAMQIHDEIIFQTPARPPKKHIRKLNNIMAEAGTHFGVETPVDSELCLRSLDKKVSVIL